MDQEYFCVELSHSMSLGIPLQDMKTVAQFETQNICVVPGIADFWSGVVNFKGSLLWVLDSDLYFNLGNKLDPLRKKVTTVVLKHQLEENQRQIALITKKLVGIISVEPNHLQQFPEQASPILRDCCSAFVDVEARNTYLLNSANLFQQLHQQSTLVSV